MTSKVVWLSHPLSPEIPAYGGGEGMRIEPITQIAAGDTANTSRLCFCLEKRVKKRFSFFTKPLQAPVFTWIICAEFLKWGRRLLNKNNKVPPFRCLIRYDRKLLTFLLAFQIPQIWSSL